MALFFLGDWLMAKRHQIILRFGKTQVFYSPTLFFRLIFFPISGSFPFFIFYSVFGFLFFPPSLVFLVFFLCFPPFFCSFLLLLILMYFTYACIFSKSVEFLRMPRELSKKFPSGQAISCCLWDGTNSWTNSMLLTFWIRLLGRGWQVLQIPEDRIQMPEMLFSNVAYFFFIFLSFFASLPHEILQYTQWLYACPQSFPMWEMPDSNPGPLLSMVWSATN